MTPEQDRIQHLYRSQYPQMVLTAERMLHDAEDARDVVADLFVRLSEGTLSLPDLGQEAYLHVCLRNECLDRIKHLSVRERITRQLTLREEPFTEDDDREQQLRELREYAGRAFTPQTWRVFQMRFDEHLKYKEIAQRLGIKENSSASQFFRAKQMLAKMINEYTKTRRI